MAGREPTPFTGTLPSSFDENADFYNEKPMQKVVRKLKEEPLVPLGVGLTVFAFVNAYRALRRGDSRQANRMFRARVAAQGFTVIAMVAGSMYYSKDREKTKELRKLQEAKDNEEKRQRWIRELEVRDEEDKRIKAALQEKVQKASAAGAGSAAPSDGSGSILGRMGLWPQEEKAKEAVDEVPLADEAATKPKKENPNSSLGVIGEALVPKNKRAGRTEQDAANDEPEK
ncbi:Respiratory supercomplex factor [Paramyrothecium foliicola]|nr:Respiratory supercomplex factor [Paramyrothecium foliicola]